MAGVIKMYLVFKPILTLPMLVGYREKLPIRFHLKHWDTNLVYKEEAWP